MERFEQEHVQDYELNRMQERIRRALNPAIDQLQLALNAIAALQAVTGSAFDDAAHGNRGGGPLHADAVAGGLDGFMTGGDKTILDSLNIRGEAWNGTVDGAPAVDVTSDGANWTLALSGGVLGCIFGGISYPFDCTTPKTLGLTAGTNASPINTHVWLILTGSTVSLDSGTDWPAVPYCPIAITLLQSAASPADTVGPFSMHAWTDHLKDALTGHIAHTAENIRNRHARWLDGCAPSVTIASASVKIKTEVGRVRQLHLHDMPEIDMGAGAPIIVTNQPVSEGDANFQINNLDDLTQAVNGASLDGKHFPLFIWGNVSEDERDCKLYMDLPADVYNTQSQAELDLDGFFVGEIPPAYIGTGFPIAKLVMQANLGGTWVLHQLINLRNPDSGSGASGGSGIQTHDDLPGRNLAANHLQYLLTDGTRDAEYLQLALAYAGGSQEGQINWNAEDGTAEIGMPGGNVTLQVGQEMLARCVNNTGSTINNGDVVYISGASGNKPEITLADASDPTKIRLIGMATEDIPNSNQGFVNFGGYVRDIDTSGIAEGATGYLSESTPGALRATAPAAPNITVEVGVCTKSNVSSGVFFMAVHVKTPHASTTVEGVAELATAAEVQTGTDNTRVVTPLGLRTSTDFATLTDGSNADALHSHAGGSGDTGVESGKVSNAIVSYSDSGGSFRDIIVATPVSANSNSGQKNLHTGAATDLLLAGQPIRIGAGTAREETNVIVSESGGTLTLENNLTFTHTAAQADRVCVDYAHLIVDISRFVPGTDDRQFWLRLNGDAGSNYRWGFNLSVESTGAVRGAASASAVATGDTAANGAFGNGTGEVAAITFAIKDFQDTTKYAIIPLVFDCYSAAADSRGGNGRGVWKNAADIDSIRLITEGGTYSGEITIGGVPHA